MSAPVPDEEELPRAILDSMTEPVSVIGPDYRYIYANRAYERFYGFSDGKILGKSIAEVIPGQLLRERIQPKIERCQKSGRTIEFEVRLKDAEGNERSLQVRYTPCREGLIAVYKDITEERAFRDELHRANELYRLITDHSADVIALYDPNLNPLYISPNIEAYCGYTPEEFARQEVMEIVHPEDLPRLEARIQSAAEAGLRHYSSEYRIRHKEGRYFWNESHTHRIYDEEGRLSNIVVTSRNVDSRRKQQETLREVSETVPGFFYQYYEDPDGGFSFPYISPGCERIYGIAVEEALRDASRMYAAVPEDEQERLAKAIRKSKEFLELYDIEHRFVSPEGEVRWLHAQAMPRRTDEGGTLWTGVALDATDRHEYEERLRTSEEKYRALYEQAPLAYQSLDEEGHFIDVNPTWLSTLGYDKDEVLGKWFGDFLHPDYVEHFRINFPRFKAAGFIHNVQFKMRRKEGSVITVAFEGCIGRDKNGAFKQTYCTFKDITEQQAAEEALKESEARYRALFSDSASAMLLIDPETQAIIDANQAAVDYYGYSKERLTGMRADELNTMPREEIAAEMEAAANSERRYFTFRHRLASGEIRDVQVYSGPVEIEGRALLYSIIHDITEQRRAESVKHDFLANMSHELRTPLNGIMGMLALLQNNQTLPEQLPYLQMAEESAEHLLYIVQDVLDLSRISAGRLELNRQEFDLVKLLRHLVELNKRSAEDKGLRLLLRASEENCLVNSDKNRISQIVLNLISNAIKYSKEGTISVRLRVDDMIRLAVEDQGIGIDPARQQEIFEPFHQLENPYTKEHGGIGAGLAIVKELCELMKGSITLESAPGRGSCFTVELPHDEGECREEEAPADRDAFQPGPADRQALKVLIVEDEAINRLYLKSLLRNRNFIVSEAGDGVEALNEIEKRRPHAVLMDIGLPRMNGIEAIIELRKREEYRALPILAVTAHTHHEDRERILAAGADDIVVKPYRESELLEKLGRATSAVGSTGKSE